MSSILAPSLRRVAFLSTYPPRLCGIATFAANLHAAIAGADPELECLALAMSDGTVAEAYPPEVRLEIPEADAGAYRARGRLSRRRQCRRAVGAA